MDVERKRLADRIVAELLEPGGLAALIDVVQYDATADFPVERGYIWTTGSTVENGNPLVWDDAAAAAVCSPDSVSKMGFVARWPARVAIGGT